MGMEEYKLCTCVPGGTPTFIGGTQILDNG